MVINPKVIHQSNSRPKSEGKFFIFSEFSNSFLFVKTYKIHFKVIELDLARPMVDISISYTIFWISSQIYQELCLPFGQN